METRTLAGGLDAEITGDCDTTMILLHGGLGLDRQYLRPLIDDCSSLARVVAYDHRGNGASAAPDRWDDISLDSLGADIHLVADELGIEKFVLFGHSYGGFIALQYAITSTDRLNGLIIASSAPHLGHPPVIPDDSDRESVEAFSALFAGPMGSDDQWRETWTQALPLYTPELSSEQRASALDGTIFCADAWNTAAGLLATYNTLDGLANIDVPTLLLSGRRDFLTGVTGHEELRDGIAKAELVVFDDAGHFPFVSQPADYKAAIATWIGTINAAE